MTHLIHHIRLICIYTYLLCVDTCVVHINSKINIKNIKNSKKSENFENFEKITKC
jgi:hypothetical protein